MPFKTPVSRYGEARKQEAEVAQLKTHLRQTNLIEINELLERERERANA